MVNMLQSLTISLLSGSFLKEQEVGLPLTFHCLFPMPQMRMFPPSPICILRKGRGWGDGKTKKKTI